MNVSMRNEAGQDEFGRTYRYVATEERPHCEPSGETATAAEPEPDTKGEEAGRSGLFPVLLCNRCNSMVSVDYHALESRWHVSVVYSIKALACI